MFPGNGGQAANVVVAVRHAAHAGVRFLRTSSVFLHLLHCLLEPTMPFSCWHLRLTKQAGRCWRVIAYDRRR
jgi:hypothetical protein